VSKQARNRSRELRQAAVATRQLSQRRHRRFAGVGAIVIVGLLVAIVVAVVNATSGTGSGTTTNSAQPAVAPANATPTGAIAVGRADAPVKVEVYLDYMCPFCGRFEQANGDELDRLVADGTVRLELHPLSFLDRLSSGTKYSTRAANAFATVADRAPDKIMAFHRALYGRQPAEGTAGLSNDEIAIVASGVGVPQNVVNTFPERIFEPWVAASTAAAFNGGVSGTPTVKINGNLFKGDLYTVGPLTEAINAAKGR
jgi:protein-disulfide isomerase